MNIEEKLHYILTIETLILVALLVSIVFVDYSTEQLNHVWEIIPAIIASMITTYGLKEMKSLT